MHDAANVDLPDGFYLSSIELVHPALLVLVAAGLEFLEYAKKGARLRPKDQVQVLGLDLLSSRPSLLWFCKVSTTCEVQ